MRVTIGAALIFACPGFAQIAPDTPAIEAAVVKANRSGRTAIGGRGICTTGGRMMVSNRSTTSRNFNWPAGPVG